MAPYLPATPPSQPRSRRPSPAPSPTRRIADALARSALPGRAELLAGEPPAIADAAHNEAGARALAEALPALAAGRPVFGCLSVLADKDAGAIARGPGTGARRCVCTAADPGPAMGRPGSRATEAGELRGSSRPPESPVEEVPDPVAAVARTVGAGKRARRGGTVRRIALPSPVRMEREARSELLSMMGLVAAGGRGGDPGVLRARLSVRPALPLKSGDLTGGVSGDGGRSGYTAAP